jgi:hypothetical protein
MPDVVISLFAVVAFITYFTHRPTMNLSVYSGAPFKGIPLSYNTIDSRGRVLSFMSEDYSIIIEDVDNNQCFDNISTWCDRMIELSGLPVHLMTDTYYPNNPLIHEVNDCQRKMFLMSGMQYS